MAEKRFRVANFNVNNFNYPGFRYYGRKDAPIPKDVYDHKVGWISKLLDTARVDLIGFEELFSQAAIEEVVCNTKYLAGATLYAPNLVDNIVAGPSGQEARGPFCGLVTRFPIVAREAILEFPDDVRGKLRVLRGDGSTQFVDVPITQFQRPVLRAQVQLREQTTATVFVAHLKSKSEQIFEDEDPDDPVIQALGSARSLILRAAEAAALRSLVVAESTGNKKPIILCGDLNDDRGSVTTQMIAGDDPFFVPADKKPLAYDRLLYSVHDIQERLSYAPSSYTHIYDGRCELLDHIFVSEEFVEQNRDHIARVCNTRTYNDHVFDSKLTSDYNESPLATSDHGVPVTEIAFTRD